LVNKIDTINNLEQILKQCINLAEVKAVILANGEVPKNTYLIQLLKDANYLICCDGAINTLEKNNIEPDYIVGDCDSLSSTQRQKYMSKIKYLPDQNYNDLTKAVDFTLSELGLNNLIILGATGLREDHSLANISLLNNYSKKVKNIVMLSDYGFFCVYHDGAIISTLPNQQISLFAVKSNTLLSTEGLKWDVNNFTLDSWYSGTLNEATKTSFKLYCNNPIIVYRAFELKK
jgi:thiamine pyrophosphokinase